MKRTRKKTGTELHIKVSFVSYCGLMDKHISVMNKYSELGGGSREYGL